MKFAYSANAYRRTSVCEAVRRIGRLGYAGIELMADEPHFWPCDTTDEQVDAIREALEEAALPISNINAFMTTAVGDFWHPSWIEPEPSGRRVRLNHTLSALRLARSLGAASITTEPGGPLPPGMSRERALDLFVDGLEAALRAAEDVGVFLLVEPEPGLLIENSEQFLELATRIASPWFGLNFDIGHFYCVGEDLGGAIRRLSRFIHHYHVEDIAATRVHEHLVPGDGAIDFRDAFHAIHTSGYQGWLTVELYPYLDDPDAAGRRALDFLTACLPPTHDPYAERAK